jgi:PAS domain S-box-containing protein
LRLPECWYWIRKLQARFLAGDYAAAVDASSRAQPLPWPSLSHPETAEYHFYDALSRASLWDIVTVGERQQHLEALTAHHRQLEIWASNCPENFENRAALVGAEIARIEGRELEAERLYQKALRSAGANGFVHNEALAYELAARFYAARGFEEFARLYLTSARDGYLRWGALGKVRQLDDMYPHLCKEVPTLAPTGTIGAPVEHLDLATVIKVSQSVSGEIVLDRLIDTLIRTAITQAGAERGLLILLRGPEQRTAAEATTRGDTIIVQLREETVTAAMLPESVLHYALRTQESVVLDDAAAQNPFAADPYVRQHHARSILCLPLLNQAKLIGVLYLENNLTPRVFAPARITVLKLLASQAAIALENTRLYRDLAEREAKIRRLVDANIIGIFIWDFDGRIIEANDAFLCMVGYDREDLRSGRIRWTELTPPEWLDRDERLWVPELKMTGSLQPFEKEYIRKDRSRVPVLIGLATFEEGGNQGVAFLLDLTERKRAEEALRESEERYRKVQMELAHASRVATMGQLTASIAHEVSQPIAAASMNADALRAFLERDTPDLENARHALGCLISDNHRAHDIIGRIRDLIKKAPPHKDRLDINGAIRDVIELARSDAVKNGVSVQMELADGLPLVEGDRVQLQQVVLNLIVNAIQAMGSVAEGARKVLITTAQAEPEGVLVGVKDSGPGLSSDRLERVFDPFYTTKSGGLGMGLSICRSIIEAHAGRLWVTSNPPGGAMFHFTVPAHPPLMRTIAAARYAD